MSALLYGAMTRKSAENSFADNSDMLKTYIDTVAALVPADVLFIHTLILSSVQGKIGQDPTNPENSMLIAAFVLLILLSIGLFWVPKFQNIKAESKIRLNYCRMFIPPVAFVTWTMLQKSTAFDAIAPNLPNGWRLLIALFLAVILIAWASVVGYKDNKIKFADLRQARAEATKK